MSGKHPEYGDHLYREFGVAHTDAEVDAADWTPGGNNKRDEIGGFVDAAEAVSPIYTAILTACMQAPRPKKEEILAVYGNDKGRLSAEADVVALYEQRAGMTDENKVAIRFNGHIFYI